MKVTCVSRQVVDTRTMASTVTPEADSGVKKQSLSDLSGRWWLTVVLGAGLLSYLPWLGCFGPTDPTDSFFLESGREMVETGKYLLPLNNYEPWLDKPILYFWMVAGAYKLFGVSPFVGRLPAALSAVALGAVLFLSTAGILRARTAAVAGLIFLCLPLSSVVGHVCLTDMTLSLMVSGTVLYLFRGWREGSTKLIVVGYIFNALALLCKGPIASILSIGTLGLYTVITRRSITGTLAAVRELKPGLGILIAACVNVPWYAAAMVVTDGKFFEAFFWQQNFGRMMGTVNHQMPWWFYIPVFFGGFFPWCILTVSVPKLFQKVLKPSGDMGTSPRRDLFRLSLCWFSVVLVLFSVIKTKLPTYILPAAPAFAILIAVQLDVLARRSQKHLVAVSVLSLVALIVACSVQFLLPSYLRTIVSHNVVVAVLVIAVVCCSLVALRLRRTGIAVLSLLAAMSTACAVFVPHGLRALHDYRQPGFNALVMMAKAANANVAILSAEEPMMPYILHKPVSRIRSSDEARTFLLKGIGPRYLLVPGEMRARLDWFPSGNRFIANNGKWFLYEVFAPGGATGD